MAPRPRHYQTEAVVRESSYIAVSGDKRTKVSYTDMETIRDVADLYAVVNGEYKGTPSTASQGLKSMLQGLQSGTPLSAAEWDFLHAMKDRYGKKLEAFRKSPENQIEGWVPVDNSSGRVSEAMALLPAAELARVRELYSTASTTKKDKDITAPHLHDGTMHDMAHAMQHAKRLQDKDVLSDPSSISFNVEHVLNHLESGIDHGSRLGKHLEENPSNPKTWRDEKTQLHQMREASASPPPNLREAPPHDESAVLAKDTPVHECCTCKMFDNGRCWGYGNIKVDPDWLCDSWTVAPDWRAQVRRKRRLAGQDPETGRSMSESDYVQQVMETSGLVDLVLRMREDAKPTVALDFDGVIYDRSNEPGGSNLAGKLIPGSEDGLKELAKHFRIVILTARPNPKAVRGYLAAHDLDQYITDVTNNKPSAAAYVDNRSLLFKNWPQVVKDLEQGDDSSYESNIPGGKT